MSDGIEVLMALKRKIIFTVFIGAVCLGAFEYLRQVPQQVIAKKLSFPDGPSARMQSMNENSRPDELRLLLLGDTGLGSAGQQQVAELLERLCAEKQAHAVLLLGDNFYYEGVKSVDDPLWQERFHQYYDSQCLANLRFIAVLGNHDYDGNPGAQILYTERSRGHFSMPARAYTVSFGNTLIISALDSNFPDRCFFALLCSLDWLERDLKESHATWKIAMGHHPMLSGGKYPRPKPYARLTIPNFLCKNGIDIYFAGHDHNAQHLEGRLADYPCDIRQVVMGNGGAELAPVKETPFTRFAASFHGAGYARFTATAASVAYYDAATQSLVHSFEIDK